MQKPLLSATPTTQILRKLLAAGTSTAFLPQLAKGTQRPVRCKNIKLGSIISPVFVANVAAMCYSPSA